MQNRRSRRKGVRIYIHFSALQMMMKSYPGVLPDQGGDMKSGIGNAAGITGNQLQAVLDALQNSQID